MNKMCLGIDLIGQGIGIGCTRGKEEVSKADSQEGWRGICQYAYNCEFSKYKSDFNIYCINNGKYCPEKSIRNGENLE